MNGSRSQSSKFDFEVPICHRAHFERGEPCILATCSKKHCDHWFVKNHVFAPLMCVWCGVKGEF